MEKSKITSFLTANSYPGRGIAIGITPDGKKVSIAYFIMGRSTNSRNRVFIAEHDDLRTKAFDPSKLSDPSLIIYHPVRVTNGTTIVTNGSQTDKIASYLQQGLSFEAALNTETFEPDGPNFTPRISGIVSFMDGNTSYKLSILKTIGGDDATCARNFFDYDIPSAGTGHFIHTYQCDGEPLPSFEGEPKAFQTENDIDTFANSVWDSLNAENKVSLFVRHISIFDGSFETRIINIHE